MLRTFGRALVLCVMMLELLAGVRRWRGLSWLGGGWVSRLLPLLVGTAVMVRGRSALARDAAALALMALPALLVQAGAASLRNPSLNPLLRLQPGRHGGYSVARLDLPMPEGYMPALYVVPEAGATAAVAVLHGSGCDKTYFAWRLMDALVSRGLAVLLLDLDGHGENPRMQSYPGMLDDASVAVAWLRERHRRVGMLGISLGGSIAARAAADGLAIDALALLETPPQLHFTAADVRREALALTEPFLLDLFGEVTPAFLGYTIYDLVRVQSTPRIRCTIGTVDLIAALDVPGSLPRIAAPLLLIYGARDAIVKPWQAEQVRQLMPPGARFHMIPGASHLSLTLAPTTLCLVGDWMAEELQKGTGNR